MLSGWNAVALYLSTEEAAEVAEELGYLFAVVPGMTTEIQFAHYPYTVELLRLLNEGRGE
jgi:hypothetical protein